jgi:hypothetical protein
MECSSSHPSDTLNLENTIGFLENFWALALGLSVKVICTKAFLPLYVQVLSGQNIKIEQIFCWDYKTMNVSAINVCFLKTRKTRKSLVSSSCYHADLI